MSQHASPFDDLAMPVLLRHARSAYTAAITSALAKAGYDDLPKNGTYVIGGLALQKGGRPLSQLIAELGISKQAAGQLVDALVQRRYLKREVEPEDRRRLTIALTERGRAAARVLGTARGAVDAEMVSRAGAKDVERARRVLTALAEIGSELNASQDDG